MTTATANQPVVLPREDVVRRGQEIYEARIKAQVEPEHKGKFVVIDILTGTYELVDDLNALALYLHGSQPGRQRYVGRVGYPTAFRRSRR